jgi:hypothetical protein
MMKNTPTKMLIQALCLALLSATPAVWGQEAANNDKKTTEPVFRVSKLDEAENTTLAEEIFQPGAIERAGATSAEGKHPLDKAIEMAHASLANMQSEVNDYTAILVKREQINGVVGEPGYMHLKVRCPRQSEKGPAPFSIYMKFLKPREAAGRECIWVNGQNESKIVAHESGGLIGRRRFHLEPTGWLAMRDNRYPIYDAGLENLIIKLIEKAERDKSAGYCNVDYREGAEINGRSCSIIELRHDEKKEPYEFHKAQVFIDDELQLPIRYAAYDWPETPGGPPKLLEEYTYVNVKLNVGLTAADFSADNPDYDFPRR